jgi:pimeloyl-ACP methyl ester carboxylesterase
MTSRSTAAKTVVPEPYRKSLPSAALRTVVGALGTLGGALSSLPLPSPKLPAVAPVGRLPTGRVVELPGRGSTYVVDSGPAAEGPTFVLLHGVASTGLLNWYPSLELMRGFGRVVVFDQRWHGSGITSPRFRLDDCADDVAALADALGIDTFVPVGFSMGSLVAQLVWRRHRDRVDALVLCAAAAAFGRAAHERLMAGTVASLLEAFSGQPGAATAPPQHGSDDEVSHSRLWALGQFRSTSSRAILRALAEIIRFDSRAWLADIDVPTAVVIPRHDQLISPRHQHWLARQIPAAHAVTVDAGHACCTLQSEAFVAGLRSAVNSVLCRMPTSATEAFGPPRELVG